MDEINFMPVGFSDLYDEGEVDQFGLYVPSSLVKATIEGDEGLFVIDTEDHVFCVFPASKERQDLETGDRISDGEAYFEVLFQVTHPEMLPSLLQEEYEEIEEEECYW